ncbi:hypothetical protein AKG60_19580 [Vibrio parahaemolyticus]|uniref:Transcriptional regulator n=1 Tax=Vibrio parahaemolyticus TaxID=670 RepID=A0AAX0M7V5_VIBPH|nr:hypothetical protein [Vibrio parahaemolyticus]MCS0328130.1 hypothetical protein [Vibrio diabolicus]EGQ8893161.1 hypothetical protein [Vibrio parahaemolyticus]EGR3310612.1 hypothetical protein [Vibrio parahaemolyticus]EJG0024135.1 hypothetical protein [Vibrio parahaemolyticus]
MKSLAFWDTPEKDVEEAQAKMDSITKSLSSEQVKTLEELIESTPYFIIDKLNKQNGNKDND